MSFIVKDPFMDNEEISYNSALTVLEDKSIMSFNLSKNNKELTIIEEHDCHFEFIIKKKDFKEFIKALNIELNGIYDNMVE